MKHLQEGLDKLRGEQKADHTVDQSGFDIEYVTKQKDWDARCQIRNEEVLALTNKIKILNDEDVAESRKKMLAAPALVQMKFTNADIRSQAIAVLATYIEYCCGDAHALTCVTWLY